MSHLFGYGTDSSSESSDDSHDDDEVTFQVMTEFSAAPQVSSMTVSSNEASTAPPQDTSIPKRKSQAHVTHLDHLEFQERYLQARADKRIQQLSRGGSTEPDDIAENDHDGQDGASRGSSKPRQRINTNTDAASTTFTGSWGAYEGEAELKQHVAELRQAQQDAQIVLETETPAIIETSVFHLPCQDEFRTTQSSNEMDVDYEYNTPAYYQQITKQNDIPLEDRSQDVRMAIAFKSATGRSFLDPPPGYKLNTTSVYGLSSFASKIPAKNVNTFKPTSKGVNCVRFFPTTGQYVISAGSDGSVKLYSTATSALGKLGCVREYNGHDSGLREIKWVDNGKRFITASYDGWVKLWDTETGKVLFRYKTSQGNRSQATPMCLSVENHEVMVGCGDGHLYGYDMRTTHLAIEYDQLQASITTMVDVPSPSQRRVFTAAADGKIVVYEWGIPSVVQHVTQHSREMLTRACVHPSNNFILANTHDNSASIFRIDDGRVRMNRKKKFDGHLTAGYTLGICCSPDGRYVVSGDGGGHLVFWDWKSGKLITKKKAHSAACIDVDWQFNSVSTMVSASWNGEVTVWK